MSSLPGWGTASFSLRRKGSSTVPGEFAANAYDPVRRVERAVEGHAFRINDLLIPARPKPSHLAHR